MVPFPNGVVAQLEERLNGIQEVVGSIPIGSTRFFKKPQETETALRDDYIQAAQKVIKDPNILINVVSRRVKQLKMGQTPLVESLERLSPEDIALREIMEGKITYELWTPDQK
jgi:DNA-directed RNA polymerase subunit omega